MTGSPAAPAEFERTEIDGLPTFVVRGATRCSASLIFRVGRADEALVDSGLSHLVEHLALFGLGERTLYSYNGRVMGLTTEFVASGTPDEVTHFLAEVTRALSDPPYSRLQNESRVLRTEAAAATTGFLEDHLWLRYGATGHGTRKLSELAALAPDAERVRAWTAEYFTAGNAALVLAGPSIPDLRLSLPDGPRRAVPVPRTIADVSYPAWFCGNSGVVSLSCSVPRREWLSLGFEIAADRIRHQLRYERGVTYDVRGFHEAVGRDLGHTTLWATALPETAQAVRDGVLAVLEELAKNGATVEETNRMREAHRRQMSDPDAGGQAAAYAAFNELIDFPIQTSQERMNELEAIDGAEIGRRLARAMKSALLIQPPECSEPAGFKQYPIWSEGRVDGRSFRHRSATFPWSEGPRLIVGDVGVMLRAGDQSTLTILYASCAAAVVSPNGIVDLFGEDGFRLQVVPELWRGGPQAIETIMDNLPPARVLRLPAAD